MSWEKDDIFLSKWLNGELSEEEKNAFEASSEGKEFMDLMNASTLIEPSTYNTKVELSKLQNRIQSIPEKKQKVIWMRPEFKIAVAASVALIIAVVFLFNGDNSIETGFSEQEIVMLPDGSEVKLNSASQLSYNSKDWEEERSLTLEGEGFFKVEKGSRFDVSTKNGTVTVLGTSFNVKSRGEMFEVVCYTGKVEVSSENNTIQLEPGQKVRVKNGEMIAFNDVQLNTEPSWTSGVTELDSISLPQVLDELRYVFGYEIEYDGSLDDLIYTGAFPNQQPEAAFRLVFEPLNIDYSFDSSSKQLVIIGLNQ